MFDFILTILIAVIIFGPAVMLILKFFGLSSDQARDSFYDLVDEIEDLAENGEEGESRLFYLIMDKGSFIVGHNANKDLVATALRLGGGLFGFTIPYPAECQGESCVCLCNEYTILPDEDKLICERKICKTLPEIRFMEGSPLYNFYLTPPETLDASHHGGFYEGGFLISRPNPDDTLLRVMFSIPDQYRRMLFYITKDEGDITLCRELPCLMPIGREGDLMIRECEAGNEENCHLRAIQYLTTSQDLTARHNALLALERNCESGYSESCLFLAHHFWPTATRVGREYYEKACTLDNWQACEELGHLLKNYYHNDETAAIYYGLSCNGGRETACTALIN